MSDFWQKNLSMAKTFRQDLHRHPELGWQEHHTAAAIRDRLTAMGIDWRPCAQTGTLAHIASGNSSGRHIALRGDIDALPIDEDSGRTWSSQQQGCMHACGHDGHTAALMATVAWLKQHEETLPGPVTFLFQPAEEGGHGAREMIADGALEGVDEIYGWHNWPAIPFGKMICPDQLVMCGNATFSITVKGRGGHASQPELCADPVLAASAITLNLQQIISRRLPPQHAAVVSVTSIEAASGLTVIPQQAVLSGSIRVPDDQTKTRINQLIEEISHHTAMSYGVACEVTIQPRYSATINHARQAENSRTAWLADQDQQLDHAISLPVMASEDFSYYLQQVPGAFALIGADDGEPVHQYPCHSPHYDFNDRLLEKVVRWYARLAGAPLPNYTG
ncbi:N(2)-acetyl-L-2,4-diaminobutanoate deacetylase DoeB2 [Photobacterium sp. 2_MG-2023]|uniref:N(2)-acetyl-L-2,4-diaminobutanoate deacetylase DoeB2 n=1 Tax=Photobacterium sp. 2_MG-2023 TaxID=3062663 RepID=UPI0026E40AC0|nr:N(2)-acetyl-L-2,4-diaminobutanoate deacetylase DoeB2 [Photobacterium sp. 2_MG-2023]MDO6583115.1 N(2)-acetyl-L-2,4-diaminobutanoate deacetylase DoeB2 [Photobacterium sp. 2_MG-2023]